METPRSLPRAVTYATSRGSEGMGYEPALGPVVSTARPCRGCRRSRTVGPPKLLEPESMPSRRIPVALPDAAYWVSMGPAQITTIADALAQ